MWRYGWIYLLNNTGINNITETPDAKDQPTNQPHNGGTIITGAKKLIMPPPFRVSPYFSCWIRVKYLSLMIGCTTNHLCNASLSSSSRNWIKKWSRNVFFMMDHVMLKTCPAKQPTESNMSFQEVLARFGSMPHILMYQGLPQRGYQIPNQEPIKHSSTITFYWPANQIPGVLVHRIFRFTVLTITCWIKDSYCILQSGTLKNSFSEVTMLC